MNPWVQAIRPKTFTAALVPIFVTIGLLKAEGVHIYWWINIFALISAISIQITTNLLNDYIDFKKGADTESRIGPKRMTQGGLITEKKILLGALMFSLSAVAFGIPLILKGGVTLLVIGLASLFMAYSYTGGPFPLAYLGLGDIFVILFFGLIAVGGVYFLNTGTYSWSAFVTGLQVGFLSTVLIVINNFRDMKEDKLVSKKTLAVRFGATFSRFEVLTLFLLSLSLGFYWIHQGYYFAAIFPLLSIPFMIEIINGLFKNSPSPLYNSYLEKSAKIQMLFSVLMTFGFLIN